MAAPQEFQNIQRERLKGILNKAETSGLVSKDELVNSFINKEALVLRGPCKYRIGTVVGIGMAEANLMFAGRPEKVAVRPRDAVNV